MAQSVIGALRVNLGLDSANFSRGLSDAQKSLKRARAQFAAVAGVAAAMGAAISAAALAGARDIDKAAKAARRLDSSIGGFRALELAAGEAGVSLSTLTDAVQTMDREIAKGSKGAVSSLQTLNLTAADLQGLDADQKMAVLSDAVKDVGLSTAQTSVVLQELGVRNREMVLAVGAGGEVFRAARADIKDYGLALGSTDAGAIEKANDALGRLGLITQYAGQQLAIALVPAMGRLAEVMTDSLREGGALRAVIDGLVGNLDRLATYIGVAVTGFGVRYVAALALATLSTATLSGALIALRTALIRTGIGVLVIAAGELVLQLSRVFKASDSVKDSFVRVYDVGKAALLGVGNTAWGLMEILAGVASAITGSFVRAFALIAKSWDMLINGMSSAWNMLASSSMGATLGLGEIGASDISGQIGAVADGLFEQAEASIKAGGQRIAAAGKSVADALTAAVTPAGDLKDVLDDSTESTNDLNNELDDLGGSGGGKAGKAGKALEKVKTEAEAYNDALKKAAHTTEDIGTEKARIMIGGIDGISSAFGEFIGSGLKGFKDFTRSIVSSFTGMISQMITLAARNKIMLGLGISPAGLGGAAAAGVPGAPGGAGLLGSLGSGAGILGGLGALTSGVGAGFSMALGGLTSGGLGGLTGVIGTQLGAATASMGAFGAAIGAVALPLAAVAAVFSFFKKKTKELDAGLRVTVDGIDALVETFSKVETKRFWGLSKKVRTSYATAAEETARPLLAAIDGIATSVLDLGDVFGFASSNIDRANVQFKISTKGKTDAEIEQAVAEEMDRLANVFADAIVGTFDVAAKAAESLTGMAALIAQVMPDTTETIRIVNEEFEALKKEGEGSYAALNRLVSSLSAVNSIMDTLGGTLYGVTLAGAGRASALVDAFGGLEALQSATSTYYQSFYAEQERLDILTRQLTTTLGGLGQAMPETRAQFRALVEAQDLATDSGRQMFAALVSLAGQFDSILPALDSLANKLGALVADAIDAALGPIDAQISASNAAAVQARNSAAEFFRLADSLRASSAGIGSIQSAADLGRAAGDFAALFAQAIGGDVAALGDLGGAGSALASDSAGFAATALELRRIEAGLAGQLNQAAAVSEALGLGADYQALLYDVQTAALEETRALLSQGDLTQEILQRQATLLENIGRAIVDSTDLQVAVSQDATGKTLAGLLDGAGLVIGSLSAEGARGLAALQAQTAAVVGSVDRNRDGVITAEEIAAARTLGGISEATIKQAQALAGQNGLFANAITGQTASVTGAQGLTNQQLGKVRDLQGETVSITELVERAVAGSETLTSALLTRLSDGISVSGVPSMVAGLGAIGALISRIVSAQEATLAAAEAEAARAEALSGAQRDLKATAEAQGSAISEVTAASAQIFKLAHEYRVFLNATAGAAYNANDAQFGVDDAGLFQAKYAQITGQTADARGFKNAFYSEGGVYSQTYGRAAELQSLAAQLQAQRQAVIDLGGIPQFAGGGQHSGGLRIVGEKGPELEYTGASQIFNARQTRDMLSGGGGDPDAVHRMLLELVKNTKRTSDLLRTWDAIGQPETRGV